MNHTDFLEKIIRRKEAEMNQTLHRMQTHKADPLNSILHTPRIQSNLFSTALKQPGLNVISEIKRRSPSKGEIGRILNPADLATEYCHGGASAVSILTDGEGFGGSLDDLHQVSTMLKQQFPKVGTLRKDFIVHPIQIAEAVQAGASAVLLIVAVLKERLSTFLKEVERLGLEALVEVDDEIDVKIAIDAGASIIGVNQRNLRTFTIDNERSKRLRPLIPSNIIAVAESGINTPVIAHQMHRLGYNAILVGEALVKASDPKKLIAEMRGII